MVTTQTVQPGKFYWVKTDANGKWLPAEAYILVDHIRFRFTSGLCVPMDRVYAIQEIKPPQ